jgi:membrane-associated protease RseP (regulator of RpoE activity)
MIGHRLAVFAAAAIFCFATNASAGFWGAEPDEFEDVDYQAKVLPSTDEAINLLNKLHNYYTAGYLRNVKIVDLQASPSEVRYLWEHNWVATGYRWVPFSAGDFIGGHYVMLSGGSNQPYQVAKSARQAYTIVSSEISNVKIQYAAGATEKTYAWRAVVTAGNTEFHDYRFGTYDLETAKKLADAFWTLRAATIPEGQFLTPRLGFTIRPKDDTSAALKRAGWTEERGLVVESVLKNSPAALAGLKKGDIVYEAGTTDGNKNYDVKFGSDGSENVTNIAYKIARHEPQGAMMLKIMRNGAPMTLNMTYENPNAGLNVLRENLAKAANPQPSAAPDKAAAPVHLGVSGRDLSAAEAQSAGVPGGVYIVDVDAGSLAERIGVKTGDYLLEIDGAAVSNMAAMRQALASGKIGKLKVWRAGKTVEFARVEKL